MALDINNLERFTAPDGLEYLREPQTQNVYILNRTPDPFTYDIFDPKEPTFQESVGKLVDIKDLVENPDFENLRNGYNWRGLSNPGEKYFDPAYVANLNNLKRTNPNQYYSILAEDIASQASANSSMNKGEHNVAFTNQLNQIKEVNPAAYYKGQFDILGESIGWQIGQNRNDRNPATFEKIQKLIPEAMQAGVSIDEINSIVNSNANFANFTNQQRIANEAASGGSGFKLSELVRGVAPIAAFAIGAPFLDAALAGGAAAGSVAGGSTAGGSIGGISLGGAFTPTAGSGASFLVPGAAAAGAGGSIGGINLGGAFTPTAGSGASFTLPGTTAAGGLMGPTYQELGYTGLEAGLAGPTYAELGYTGLNNAEAIAAADAAAKGFSAKNLLSGANQANKLAKLLTQGGSQTGKNMGMRNMLVGNEMAQQPLFEQFGGLYKMNENPFNFGTQGQSVASPGMYDVSGSNPMANALRKS